MKVLIVGYAIIDAYMWGKIERQSPEAPIPIVEIEKHENRLGGAGNVARNIKSLGATPILCSVVGDDYKGKHLKELLEKEFRSGLFRFFLIISCDLLLFNALIFHYLRNTDCLWML